MDCLDLTLATIEENLALDEALLLQAEDRQAGEVLRLWEWPVPAVVLGAGGKLAEDVDEERCGAEGVPIRRRSSGGGTVLLGRGCFCFSLVLRLARSPLLEQIRLSYRFILDEVLAALDVPGAEVAGISDLAIAGRKFSGNAQQRKRDFILHHGTILYAFDLPRLSAYLQFPARQPEYRAGREHQSFVCNIGMDSAELRRRLCARWQATEMRTTWPAERVRQLVDQRYGVQEWIRRR